MILLFALGVSAEFLFYGGLLFPRFPDSTIELFPDWADPFAEAMLLFGHAVIVGILSFFILRRVSVTRSSHPAEGGGHIDLVEPCCCVPRRVLRDQHVR